MKDMFGLRWREWSTRSAVPVVREKWFSSDETRNTFAERVSEKDNFYEFVAFPQRVTIH